MQDRAIISAADSALLKQSKAAPRAMAARLLTCLPLIIMLAGCSISMPIGSMFGSDDEPGKATGSVDPSSDAAGAVRLPSQTSLAEGMSSEDIRRSQSALALALDPEGNGVPVNWDNPQSGSKGSFRSNGEFFLVGNQLCRRFVAELGAGQQPTAYDGRACRAGPQNWVIVEAKAEGSAPDVKDTDATAQR